jgi:hypothetical protein
VLELRWPHDHVHLSTSYTHEWRSASSTCIMSASAYEHDSDWETDSDTTIHTASDTTIPTSSSRGGRGDDFSGLLEDTILTLLQDQRANKVAVAEHREDFGISQDWRKKRLCWWKRHRDSLPKEYDESTPPDGRTISICIATFASEQKSKDSPIYVETIDNGLRALTSETKVRHPGWSLQPADQDMINNRIAHLVQTEQVRTHRFEKALPSLQLQSAALIARRVLVRAVEESWSFDALANQILILSMMVCTAARAGDLGWAAEDDPYAALQIGEIELYLGPGEAILANVVLRIETNRYKGNRGGGGESRRHILSSFERQENAVISPVGRMIDMLIRRGLLKGTVEEILVRTQAHPLRRLEIGTPEDAHKPVVLHLIEDATYHDSGLRAASSNIIWDTMNDLG